MLWNRRLSPLLMGLVLATTAAQAAPPMPDFGQPARLHPRPEPVP